jgi:hypothetical protein
MSLFDLIRYPVNKDTCDFFHIPDDMWLEYVQARKAMSIFELNHEGRTHEVLIGIIKNWDTE